MNRYYYRLTSVCCPSVIYPMPSGLVVSNGDWVDADSDQEAADLIAEEQMWEYERYGPTEYEITKVEPIRTVYSSSI